jgi:hypothetical protein
MPRFDAWHGGYVCAILLEAPDPALRNDALGMKALGQLRGIKLQQQSPEYAGWRRVQMKIFEASGRAASGHFDEARQLIEEALADPVVQGPGEVRALARVDLESRLRSYRAGVRHLHPESHAFWNTYSISG